MTMNTATDPSTVWAHAVAATTLIAGYLVAFVPHWVKYQQLLIVVGAVVLSAGVLIAHSIRYGKKGSNPVIDVENLAKQVIPKIDLNGAVRNVLAEIGAKAVGTVPVADTGGTAAPPVDGTPANPPVAQ